MHMVGKGLIGCYSIAVQDFVQRLQTTNLLQRNP